MYVQECVCLYVNVCIRLKESSITTLPPGCLSSDGCVVTTHCGFNSRVSDNQYRLPCSRKLIVLLYIFFRGASI